MLIDRIYVEDLRSKIFLILSKIRQDSHSFMSLGVLEYGKICLVLCPYSLKMLSAYVENTLNSKNSLEN